MEFYDNSVLVILEDGFYNQGAVYTEGCMEMNDNYVIFHGSSLDDYEEDELSTQEGEQLRFVASGDVGRMDWTRVGVFYGRVVKDVSL